MDARSPDDVAATDPRDERPEASVRAFATTPDRLVFVEEDNTDGWMATADAVDVVR